MDLADVYDYTYKNKKLFTWVFSFVLVIVPITLITFTAFKVGGTRTAVRGPLKAVDCDKEECPTSTPVIPTNTPTPIPFWISYHGLTMNKDKSTIYQKSLTSEEKIDLLNNATTNNGEKIGDININPIWSPDGAKLVFESLQENRRDLFLYDEDSKKITRLTTLSEYEESYNQNPVWSPDSIYIAYQAQENFQSVVSDIRIIDINTQKIYKVTNNSTESIKKKNENPIWSGNSEYLIFSSKPIDGEADIFNYLFRPTVDDAKGYVLIDSTQMKASSENLFSYPMVSQDKGELRVGYIYIKSDSTVNFRFIGVDGTEKIKIESLLTPDGKTLTGKVTSPPVWSPDGSYIAFNLAESGKSYLYVLNLETSKISLLVDSSKLQIDNAQYNFLKWSPDSTKLSFDAGEGSREDIYVVELKTNGKSDYHNLTQGQKLLNNLNKNANWSQESDKLLFYSANDNRTGSIYVINSSGINLIKETDIQTPDGYENVVPVWRPKIVSSSTRKSAYNPYPSTTPIIPSQNICNDINKYDAKLRDKECIDNGCWYNAIRQICYNKDSQLPEFAQDFVCSRFDNLEGESEGQCDYYNWLPDNKGCWYQKSSGYCMNYNKVKQYKDCSRFNNPDECNSYGDSKNKRGCYFNGLTNQCNEYKVL